MCPSGTRWFRLSSCVVSVSLSIRDDSDEWLLSRLCLSPYLVLTQMGLKPDSNIIPRCLSPWLTVGDINNSGGLICVCCCGASEALGRKKLFLEINRPFHTFSLGWNTFIFWPGVGVSSGTKSARPKPECLTKPPQLRESLCSAWCSRRSCNILFLPAPRGAARIHKPPQLAPYLWCAFWETLFYKLKQVGQTYIVGASCLAFLTRLAPHLSQLYPLLFCAWHWSDLQKAVILKEFHSSSVSLYLWSLVDVQGSSVLGTSTLVY